MQWYSSQILTITLLLLIIQCAFGDENPQAINDNKKNTEGKKTLEYFVQDNQLGSQWPHGIVPYYLNPEHYDNLVARRVRVAMNSLEESSCVKFKSLPEANHYAPWVHISNPAKLRECVHTRENVTTLEVPLVLGYECLQRREILHALMHAIGFKDEVTHPQRDQYVRVQWENINPKYHSLFRVRYDDFTPVKIEYDPNSIMHFHDRAFSRNGQATIAPLIPGLAINPTSELSPLDKMKLRLIFGHECNKRRVGDLLDSCKMVMRNDTDDSGRPYKKDLKDDDVKSDRAEDVGGDAGGDSGVNVEGDTKGDSRGEVEGDKTVDEPQDDNNGDELGDQNDKEAPESKDIDNANVEEDNKDASSDEQPDAKRHRRHHVKFNRYRP